MTVKRHGNRKEKYELYGVQTADLDDPDRHHGHIVSSADIPDSEFGDPDFWTLARRR